MNALVLKPAESCRYDAISLGEVMLRLDPGASRVRTARNFQVWEGGGEYNVARGLAKCFRLRTAVVTALADNEVGRLVEDLICQGGVDTNLIRWLAFDGVGRSVRNSLNFTDRGFGVRPAVGVSDRGHSAAGQLQPGDVDWHYLFDHLGVRWLHTGGIYAALSMTTPDVIVAAMKAAREHGTVISYDLNYRPSLWREFGGQAKAQEVNRQIARYVDVMIGNEEDFSAALGFDVPDTNETFSNLETSNFKKMMTDVTAEFPNLALVATTMRTVRSASVNDWAAIAWSSGSFFESATRDRLEIFDRVGGGDSFASGLIYGLMKTGDPALAVEYGAAHGALAMTTPGDTSMVTLSEVEHLVRGGSARVQR